MINDWAEHIRDPWENLQVNVEVHSITLILETNYYTTSASTTSHSSRAPSSFGNDEMLDLCNEGASFSDSDAVSKSTDPDVPPNLHPSNQLFGGQSSWHAGKEDPHGFSYPVATKMAPQDSGYPGFDQWNQWPEQYVSTRSQS